MRLNHSSRLLAAFRTASWVVVILAAAAAASARQADAISSQERAGAPMSRDLSSEQVEALIQLALKNIDREFPNKPSVVMTGPEDVRAPRELFPAFYGCFDWHSSVHGHWMLVRMLRLFPETASAEKVRSVLDSHLTIANIETESKLFQTRDNKTFERMYGWAWYLRLVIELEAWTGDEDAARWRQNLVPLEKVLVANVIEYLPKLTYPIRIGEHADTGFALGQIWDYAQVVGNRELASAVETAGRRFYLADIDYPTRYEPSGQDFFSSCWNEADFMRRILPPDEFREWFDAFLPRLADGDAGNLLNPVEVSDVTDGKLVHLAGLDLSRAWCLNGVASRLNEADSRRRSLLDASNAHGQVGLRYVFSGHYEGDHWLATFAVYWLTRVSLD